MNPKYAYILGICPREVTELGYMQLVTGHDVPIKKEKGKRKREEKKQENSLKKFDYKLNKF